MLYNRANRLCGSSEKVRFLQLIQGAGRKQVEHT